MKFTKLSDSNLAAMYAGKSLVGERRVVFEVSENADVHAGAIEARAKLALDSMKTKPEVDTVESFAYISAYILEVKNKADYKALEPDKQKSLDTVFNAAIEKAKGLIAKAKDSALERIEQSGRKFGLELTKQLLEQRKAETEKHEGDFRNTVEDLDFQNNQSIQGVGGTLNYAERFKDSNNAIHEINRDQIQTAYTLLLSAIYIEQGKDAAMAKVEELKQQYALTLEKMKDVFKMKVGDKETNLMDHCTTLGLTDSPDYSALSGRVWGLIYSGNETFKDDAAKRKDYEKYVKGEFTRILDLYKNKEAKKQTDEMIYQEILKIKSATEWNDYANVKAEAMPTEIEGASKNLNSRLRGMSLIARNTARDMYSEYTKLGKEKGLSMIHDERMALAGKGNKLLDLIKAELENSKEDDSVKNEAKAAQKLLDEVTKNIETNTIPKEWESAIGVYHDVNSLDSVKLAEFERDKTSEVLKVTSLLNLFQQFLKSGYESPANIDINGSLGQINAYLMAINNAKNSDQLTSAISGNATNLAKINTDAEKLSVTVADRKKVLEVRRKIKVEVMDGYFKPIYLDHLLGCDDGKISSRAEDLINKVNKYWNELLQFTDSTKLDAYIKSNSAYLDNVKQEYQLLLRDYNTYQKNHGGSTLDVNTTTSIVDDKKNAPPSDISAVPVAPKQPPSGSEGRKEPHNLPPTVSLPATVAPPEKGPDTKEDFEGRARGAVASVLDTYRAKTSAELEKVTANEIIGAIQAAAGRPDKKWKGSIAATGGIVLEYSEGGDVMVPSQTVSTLLTTMVAAKDREEKLAREDKDKEKNEDQEKEQKRVLARARAKVGAIIRNPNLAVSEMKTRLASLDSKTKEALAGTSLFTVRLDNKTKITAVFDVDGTVDVVTAFATEAELAKARQNRESRIAAGRRRLAAGTDTRVAGGAAPRAPQRKTARRSNPGHVVGGVPLPPEGPTNWQKTMNAWSSANATFKRHFETLHKPAPAAAKAAAAALNRATRDLTPEEKSSLNGREIYDGRWKIHFNGNRFNIS